MKIRQALLTGTAMAFAGALAAGPASAADMLSVGVGGYMEQWIGVADREDMNQEGGTAQQSDAEIHFRGSLEADNGLKFTVHAELEGDRGSNAIDETFARVGGEFGQIEIGARDHAMVRMHYGISDVGVGLNAGDTQKWIPGTYLETSGHAIGNARKVNYISPRMNGLQVGISYAPDNGTQAPVDTVNGNDDAAVAAAVNLNQEVGDFGVKVSLGHMNNEQADKDDRTYTNAGLAVTTGAFGFNVAWAENDGGDDTTEDDDYTVWGASVTYTDGPMAVSLGHMTHEQDSGGERGATMLSGSYTLAPGVSWRTSVFAVEDDTMNKNVTDGKNEGTAFVTGIKIGF